jgi:hypothetical protein
MLLNTIRQGRGPLLSLLLGVALGLGLGALQACDSNASDCSAVCHRYRECVSSNYDLGACQTRCQDQAGKNRDFDDRLAHCRSCSEDRSCSEIVASCIPACVGIVP